MPPNKDRMSSQTNTEGDSKRGRKPGSIESTLGVRYRALVEQVPAIIYIDSAEDMFKTHYINPQLKVITGYEPEEWINDCDLWNRIISPEDRDRVINEYIHAYDCKEPSKSEYRIRTRDGRTIWVSDETKIIRDRKGKPLFWQGVMFDITARKHAEQIQIAIYQISNAVVTTTSLDELYRTIHGILGELMPISNLYIALYDPATDLISYPYYVDEYDAQPAPAKPEHGLTEYVLRTKKPLWAKAEVFTKLVEQGEVETVGTDSVDWIGVPLMLGERIIGVMVTQSYTEGVVYNQEQFDLMKFISTQVAMTIAHKLDQQRITDALAYNKTLINSSSLGIMTFDKTGQCILANESVTKIFGTSQENSLRKNYNQIKFWKDTGLLNSAREATITGKETRREIQTTNTRGEEIWLDCRFTPFESDGEPHLLLSVDNITESKQAEVNLQIYAAKLEQSNRDLQEFAYIASHDLQEPLRKVLAFGDRLSNKYTHVLDETGRDYLKRMRDASQRMQILINDLLNFSRVSTRAQPFTNVSLDSIARDVVSDLENQIDRSQGKVEIDQLPTIEADPVQMHQLLQNLINNGLKFHQAEIPPIVRVWAEVTGGSCKVYVADNGIGFDMQYLDRIFKPFQRLHSRQEYEGSGMGLAICRRIVERHSGDLTATSRQGEGSTFIISVPISQAIWENNHAQ